MKKPYLSVVIPCYNEEKNLKRGVLSEIEKYLQQQKYSSKVIIVDDGSTDNSKKLVEEFVENHPRFRLLKSKHAGKPFAIKAGLAKARGEVVLFTDMDQSTPITQLAKLLPFFKENYQVVIGSRGTTRKNFPLIRKVMSKVFSYSRRLLILPEITDTQCGFKAFRRETINKIFSKLEIFKKGKKARGWRVSAYDVEVIFVAKKLGFKIKEVLVVWEDRDIAMGKQKNFIRESKEMLMEILRVRLNDILGRY